MDKKCVKCGEGLVSCGATSTVGKFSAYKIYDGKMKALTQTNSELQPFVCSNCGYTEGTRSVRRN